MYYTHPTRDSAWPKKKKNNFAAMAAKLRVYICPTKNPNNEVANHTSNWFLHRDSNPNDVCEQSIGIT